MSSLRQFLLTDKSLQAHDAKFWESALDGLLAMYVSTSVDSADSVEAKSIVCAKLSGLGLAIHSHFAGGVQSLTSLDHKPSQESGVDTFMTLVKHTDAMELMAKKRMD